MTTDDPTFRINWTIEQRVRHEKEMEAKRAAWEERRRLEKEHAAREAEQERYSRYLRERGIDYLNRTGERPSFEELTRWRDEYAASRFAEKERERARRLAQVEDIANS